MRSFIGSRQLLLVMLIVGMLSGCTTWKKTYWEKVTGSDRFECPARLVEDESRSVSFSVRMTHKFKEKHYNQRCSRHLFFFTGLIDGDFHGNTSLSVKLFSLFLLIPVDVIVEPVNVATMPFAWLGGSPSIAWKLSSCDKATVDGQKNRIEDLTGDSDFDGTLEVVSVNDGRMIYKNTKSIIGKDLPLVVVSNAPSDERYIWSAKGKFKDGAMVCPIDEKGEISIVPK